MQDALLCLHEVRSDEQNRRLKNEPGKEIIPADSSSKHRRLDGRVKDRSLAPHYPIGSGSKDCTQQQKEAQVSPIGKLGRVNYGEGGLYPGEKRELEQESRQQEEQVPIRLTNIQCAIAASPSTGQKAPAIVHSAVDKSRFSYST